MQLRLNAIVTNKDGNILVLTLKKGPFKDGLCIPGGGICPGELSYEAVKREILEETGIIIDTQPTPFGFCELIDHESLNHRVVILLQSTGEGIPIETEEGIAEWKSKEEIETRLIPFAKEALRIWEEKQIHFKILNPPQSRSE